MEDWLSGRKAMSFGDTFGGNVTWHRHYGKIKVVGVGSLLKLPKDKQPTTPLSRPTALDPYGRTSFKNSFRELLFNQVLEINN